MTMDLLLDVDIALELCGGEAATMAELFASCQQGDERFWLYAGAVTSLLDGLTEKCQATQGGDVAAAKVAARKLLAAWQGRLNWLAALAGEGAVFDAEDPALEQLLRAARRFPAGGVRLLSRRPALLASQPELVQTPEQYLASRQTCNQIDFIDLKTQQDRLRPLIEDGIHRVLHHGQYILGAEVLELERQLAAYVGVKHCITVSDGTTALLMALMALGVGPGDEVITTPFTFVATVEMICLLGARPVFVDIDPATYNIDATRIAAAITPRTRAILPVSLFGQCAEMAAINAVAAQHGLPVLEDGAESFGATYHGRRSCGLSTIATTSFFPAKPLGCYGDGGACFSNDDALAQAIREIRVHGAAKRYHHDRLGLNGRMDTMQAAVVLAKLQIFDEETARRAELAAKYAAWLDDAGIKRQRVLPEQTCAYGYYVIEHAERDRLIAAMKQHGIACGIHFPVPMHLLKAFAHLGHHPGDFPLAERAASRVLSLPFSPWLSAAQQDTVLHALAQALSP